jgi:hypothetical protein
VNAAYPGRTHRGRGEDRRVDDVDVDLACKDMLKLNRPIEIYADNDFF